VFWDSFKVWQVIFFLAMGWLAIIRISEIVAILPMPFVYMLIGGGVAYSLGTVVYALKRLPYHHAVWHLFVLAGAGLFFVGVYGYL
ncbi:MAG TPA: hemolysin III family protein, partial [Longimicrobiales bacterium]|nr:hemolysin III family protein [Longimicrobiales bacterium]